MAAEIDVREASLSALMLAGTIGAAELAVSETIAAPRCDVAVDELLVATAECAIQRRDESLPRAEIGFSLPPKLRGVAVPVESARILLQR